MKLYRVIMFFFAVSLFGVAMNAGNVFNTKVVTQDLNASTSEIKEIVDTSSSSGVESGGFLSDLWGGITAIARGIKVLWNTGWSVLDNFNSWLGAYGIPSYIRDMFYGMLLLIVGYGILMLIMNRSEKQ